MNVSASPTWATIRVDGKAAGPTPTVIVGLGAGRHTVEALPSGTERPQLRTGSVQPGQTIKVEFKFEAN